jgi:hypothetical protein
MKKHRSVLVTLFALTLLGFNIEGNAAASTLEATSAELALIKHVKENGGMVNKA